MSSDCSSKTVANDSQIEKSGGHCHFFGAERVSMCKCIIFGFFVKQRRIHVIDCIQMFFDILFFLNFWLILFWLHFISIACCNWYSYIRWFCFHQFFWILLLFFRSHLRCGITSSSVLFLWHLLVLRLLAYLLCFSRWLWSWIIAICDHI